MKHIKFISLCLISSLVFTGCGLHTSVKNENVVTEIQKEYDEEQICGILSMSMDNSNIAVDFKSEKGKIFATDLASYSFYIDENTGYYNNGSGWTEVLGEYKDIFSLKEDKNLIIADDEKVGDNDCFTIQKNDNAVLFQLLSTMMGIHPDSISDINILYHVDKKTKELINIELSAKVNKDNETYELTGTVTLDDKDNGIEITKPEEVQYTKGNINLNDYINEYFQIKITGNNFVTFNQTKTDEIQEQYTLAKSSFSQEAYAENGIRKVSIVKGVVDLKSYLEKCKAKNISEVLPISISGVDFQYALSQINQSKTITYSMSKGNNYLYITLYYSDDIDIETFKTLIGQINSETTQSEVDPSGNTNENTGNQSEIRSEVDHSDAKSQTEQDNPDETKQDNPQKSSIIKEADNSPSYKILTYEAKVPEGMSYDETSSNIDAKLTGSVTTIHVLGFKNDTSDNEVNKESSGAELVSKETIALDSGLNYIYMILKNEEGNLTYYSYIGLVEKNNDVLKIYTVAKDNSYSFKDDFTKIATGIK